MRALIARWRASVEMCQFLLLSLSCSLAAHHSRKLSQATCVRACVRGFVEPSVVVYSWNNDDCWWRRGLLICRPKSCWWLKPRCRGQPIRQQRNFETQCIDAYVFFGSNWWQRRRKKHHHHRKKTVCRTADGWLTAMMKVTASRA